MALQLNDQIVLGNLLLRARGVQAAQIDHLKLGAKRRQVNP